MTQHQQTLATQAEHRKKEVELAGKPSYQKGTDTSKPINMGDIYSRAAEPGSLSRLSSQTGTDVFHPTLTSQASTQNTGGTLSHPSQKGLKDKLAAKEDKLIEQQEWLEKTAEQQKEEPSK